jgi:hypothetical protein
MSCEFIEDKVRQETYNIRDFKGSVNVHLFIRLHGSRRLGHIHPARGWMATFGRKTHFPVLYASIRLPWLY